VVITPTLSTSFVTTQSCSSSPHRVPTDSRTPVTTVLMASGGKPMFNASMAT
jgi:hypothetical protein